MSENKVQLKKRIHQIQEGGSIVLIAFEGEWVSTDLIKKLGYDVADVAVAPALKAVKPADVENKAVKPAASKKTTTKSEE